VFCTDLPLKPGVFNLPLHMAGMVGTAGTTDVLFLHPDSPGLVTRNNCVYIEMSSAFLFTIVYLMYVFQLVILIFAQVDISLPEVCPSHHD
jgi:hypothetical protein